MAAVGNHGGTLEGVLCVRVFDPGGSSGCLDKSDRHKKKAHSRGVVGVDLLTGTPVDEAGKICLIVILVFYTKYTWATPAKKHTAHTVASSLFSFSCTFGMYGEL